MSHPTHRCHNRAFLLMFARDRDAYRAKLREQLARFDVALLLSNVWGRRVRRGVGPGESKVLISRATFWWDRNTPFSRGP